MPGHSRRALLFLLAFAPGIARALVVDAFEATPEGSALGGSREVSFAGSGSFSIGEGRFEAVGFDYVSILWGAEVCFFCSPPAFDLSEGGANTRLEIDVLELSGLLELDFRRR